MMVVTSRSPQETEALGHQIGRTLRSGAVLGLSGELGAGKTCFARGVARALGVGGPVTSPTFTLVNEYRGTLTVYHVDAYRTAGPAELSDLGLDEYFDGEGVTVVEWADKLGSLLPPRAIWVDIAGVGDEPRTITVRGLDR
jgi:tRNA threonylcarbamoyladenosine biosynthesis protein TsaE